MKREFIATFRRCGATDVQTADIGRANATAPRGPAREGRVKRDSARPKGRQRYGPCGIRCCVRIDKEIRTIFRTFNAGCGVEPARSPTETGEILRFRLRILARRQL